MFNNFVNIHDFIRIAQRIKRESVGRHISHFLKNSDQKVIATWNDKSYENPTNWWNIPSVVERWNFIISGDKTMNYRDHVQQRYLHGKKGLRALVLGCGAGEKTVLWARLGIFERIDAYDMSDARIKRAKILAKKNNVCHIVNFNCGDVRKLTKGAYDLVIVENALHHFSPVEEILNNVHAMIKDDGLFIIDEFVGQDRFQWTKRQIDAVNGCLMLLPEKYKKFYNSEAIKSKVHVTGTFFMKVSDPSEAVESSKILPCIHERFRIIEEKNYGGGIMHLLFNAIAHNFLNDSEETRAWLRIIFSIEDVLMKNDEVKGDFVFGVYGKTRNEIIM